MEDQNMNQNQTDQYQIMNQNQNMNQDFNQELEEKKKPGKIKKTLIKIYRIISFVAIVLVISFVIYRVDAKKTPDEPKPVVTVKTRSVSFDNIGELATQEVYCNEIGTSEKPAKQIFNVDIPFTSSKCIYTCGVTVKAGCDFSEITWDENNNVVKVKLPAMRIFNPEIDNDSYAVYDEDSSVFNPIKSEDVNLSFKELKVQAEADAEKAGILTKATENAETLIKDKFIEAGYTEDNGYTIVFETTPSEENNEENGSSEVIGSSEEN
ncbi:MAG: DUF4230 domain-containing protein [Lachnospiraceae bacterium]|nr:DUF4230 domain-containing protein [Lachnospiraceae bacterium]